MQTIRRTMSRQETATWAVALALVFVVVYSFWGASVLRHERQARAEGAPVVVNR